MKFFNSFLLMSSVCFMAGCATGGSNNQPSPQTASIINHDGPLSYHAVAARLGPIPGMPKASISSVEINGAKTAANSEWGDWANTAAAAGLAATMAPEAASVLLPISTIAEWADGLTGKPDKIMNSAASIITWLYGGSEPSYATVAQIKEIQSQINTINQNITKLQNEITQDNAVFIEYINQQASNSACGAMNNLGAAVGVIQHSNPINGKCSINNDAPTTASLVYQIINLVNSDVNRSAVSSTTMTNMQTLLLSASSDFQKAVYSISATDENNTALSTSSIINFGPNPSVNFQVANISQSIINASINGVCTTGQGNAMQEFLQCGYNTLPQFVPYQGSQRGDNLSNNLDNYNNLIMMYFQQSLLALQSAYTIEATANYMNYVNYVNYVNGGTDGSLQKYTQISPPEFIQSIAFSVGEAAMQIQPSVFSKSTAQQNVELASQYLTVAQQNLTILYAARINTLYRTVMNFIVSDQLITSQSYTAPIQSQISIGNNTINIPSQGSLYSTVSTSQLRSTQGSSVPSSGILGSGGAFYQYSGINQLYPCTQGVFKTIQNPNRAIPQIDLSNCTSAFPNSGSATYDGVNLSAYHYQPQQNTITLSNTLSLSQRCNDASSDQPFFTGSSNPYLECQWLSSSLLPVNIQDVTLGSYAARNASDMNQIWVPSQSINALSGNGDNVLGETITSNTTPLNMPRGGNNQLSQVVQVNFQNNERGLFKIITSYDNTFQSSSSRRQWATFSYRVGVSCGQAGNNWQCTEDGNYPSLYSCDDFHSECPVEGGFSSVFLTSPSGEETLQIRVDGGGYFGTPVMHYIQTK